MSAAASLGWRPVYDANETVEQFAARQRQAFAAFELAWRDGRVSIKLKGYYDQLVRDVGANAYTWWTEERWAEAFGVSASTIKRVLRALTKAGLIRRERQFAASSRTFLTVYDRATRVMSIITDNAQFLPNQPAAPTQPDIININDQEDHDAHTSTRNQNPDAPHAHEEKPHYRQSTGRFFRTSPDPTFGSLLLPDHLKTRHLTIGAAGKQAPAAAADPLTRQVLARERVTDFVLAPQLAQQAAGELEAVSQYLDTQAAVRDRPRLFAWLATHGFGRQLLAGRTARLKGSRRRQCPQPRPTPQAPPTPGVVQPPTAQTALWTEVLGDLRSDGTVPDLPLWLDGALLLHVTDSAAVIGTPTVLHRDALAPYQPQLARALGAALGRTVEVTVVVDGGA